jgi:hypothetical protein
MPLRCITDPDSALTTSDVHDSKCMLFNRTATMSVQLKWSVKGGDYTGVRKDSATKRALAFSCQYVSLSSSKSTTMSYKELHL